MQGQEAIFSSASVEWGTPPHIFDKLDREFHFVLDVCASQENAKCKFYFTKDHDGLKQNWVQNPYPHGGAVWMNPPYGEPEMACKPNCKKKRCKERGHHIDEYQPGIVDWMRKAYEEAQKGATVVCLIPAKTETRWWHKYAMYAHEIRAVEGRIQFVQDGKENSAPFPSAIVIFRGKPKSKPAPKFVPWSQHGEVEEVAPQCPAKADTSADPNVKTLF